MKNPRESLNSHSFKKVFLKIYHFMLSEHGPQGWWPLTCEISGRGYHPGKFLFPKTRQGRLEVCLGAILTQNTAWTNVEKALAQLKAQGALQPEGLLKIPDGSLEVLIQPAGYFRQKARYIKAILQWFQSYDGQAKAMETEQLRESLLACKGVGPETADSILLYAYGKPSFVVDAYTRRIFSALGLVKADWPYARIQEMFHRSLPNEVFLFQEYHALIVEHAKRHYGRKPESPCPLQGIF